MQNGHSQHGLQCMEIWGGNHAVDQTASTPGLDAYVLSLPLAQPGAAENTGGDIHYVSLCGGGIITRAIVADVAGHGHHVDGTARALRQLMRKNINAKDQRKLVRALNDQFSSLHTQNVFATAVVVTYIATDHRLTLCNAGHPRPLWYRAKLRAWRLIPGDADESDGANSPLGVIEGTSYRQFAVKLDPGDIVLLYTDMLIEARDASGAMLGEKGLLKLAEKIPAGNGEQAANALLKAVRAHSGESPVDDDATVLALTHTGAGRRAPGVAERLRVYGKVFRLIKV